MPTGQYTRNKIPETIRFFRLVEKTATCWIWNGFVRNEKGKGYGFFQTANGKSIFAHRFSYELHKGFIPFGLEVDHICMNKRCVNPNHLEAVTHKENMRRWSFSVIYCKRGHKFTENNTTINRAGSRCCLQCRHKANTLQLKIRK